MSSLPQVMKEPGGRTFKMKLIEMMTMIMIMIIRIKMMIRITMTKEPGGRTFDGALHDQVDGDDNDGDD